MEYLLGSRIALTPRPVQRQPAALEVAMLGHCPGRVRPERLRVLTAALEDMRAVGFGAAVQAIVEGSPGELYHLPIPLRASAEFHDIFPDAASADTRYVSELAGRRAWLAQAVDDFFANGGEKLWVVRIPEQDPTQPLLAPQTLFFPAEHTLLHDVRTLRGLASVLVIPTLAAVALPDLERLQVPPRLPDIPRVRLENPNPQFLPMSEFSGDDHRERRYPSELAAMPEPLPLQALVAGLLQQLQRHRPDVQCLLTLPLAYSTALDSPVADPVALSWLQAFSATAYHYGDGYLLRHVQMLFPYLRGPRFELQSPVGVVAGKQAAVARSQGPWRSMAALPLVTDALPYPRLSMADTLKLREQPGIGIINRRQSFNGGSQLSLDDERLMVPALAPSDYANGSPERYAGFRSAEVMRFLGFLRRQLQALGDQLVFNIDYRDPRPRILLEQFFRRLFERGALRGKLPEQAFRITESQPQEGAVLYEIEIAPAFPIDRIYLTFTNQNGEWQTEVTNA